MKFIENTKSYFGKLAIRKYIKSHKRSMTSCNIDEAKTIGILFNATNPGNFEVIKEFVSSFSNKKSSIDVMGFVDDKQLIDQYLYRKGFEFFTRNQLNWYYKPNIPSVEDFIKKPFDLLLDLTLDNPFPIRYITMCSVAKFKAGRYYTDYDYLDLMIDIEKEMKSQPLNDNPSEVNKKEKSLKQADINYSTEIQLNFLITQLLHYLSLLKK